MSNISISISNIKRKNTTKNVKKHKEKILLTYHGCIPEVPEYYTYIDADNNEKIFNDNTYKINKISSSKYIAKKNTVNKINLTYIPGKKTIEPEYSYFTYNDNKRYLDKAIYDINKNSYIGFIESSYTESSKIILYSE